MSSERKDQCPDHSFETLAPVFAKVTKSFKSLTKGMEKLDAINDSMIAFNSSFGAFLYGLTMLNESTTWPERPSQKDIETFKHLNDTKETIQPPPTQSKKVIARKIGVKRKESHMQEPAKRKKRRTTNINVMSIINRLPLIYREQTENMKNMKTIIRTLLDHPEGLTSREIMAEVSLPSHTITPCINALILTKDAVKKSEPGLYSKFYFNPK